MSEKNEAMTPPAGGRNPLVIVLGFTLLGAAIVLVVFGSALFGGGTPLAPAVAPGSSVIDQAGDLADAAPAEGANAFTLPAGAPQVGDVAPAFALSDLEGNRVALADFRGHPVILNFWATWCPPCRIEMPDLQALYEEHQKDGLVILALDKDEPAETVRAFFYGEMGLSFTPLLDQNSTVGDIYGAFNLPTSYFVDGNGIITAVHRGFMTRGQMDGYLAQTVSN